MNEHIIKEIATTLQVTETQVTKTLALLSEGNTIPFIARYRKEVTGALDEEQIRSIHDVYEYQVNLLKRKEDVIRLIDEKGLMTEALQQSIMKASKLVEVEDLYRPYKEKKKTKATAAIAAGLEPLSKMMMSFPTTGTLETLAQKFLNDQVPTIEEAITGASYIIAEWISDHAGYRKWIRTNTYLYGILRTKLKKNAEDHDRVYEMYYDYHEIIKQVKPHRVLAINRGEKEKILSVTIEIDKDKIFAYLEAKLIKQPNSFVTDVVKEAIRDSYKRLIAPSIERELRSELTDKASTVAIANFGKNLEQLLLQPPMKEKMVLGFDPAYRTGCKLAVIDQTGKMLDIQVIYPHAPQNKVAEARKIVLDLVQKYQIDIVAIGNGTASRESVQFIVDTIKVSPRPFQYVIVNEAGASVYSASKLAISEYPDLTVEKRSAISIGRRLQDPLAELVKIDPESIGVGLYQHDVPHKELTSSLDFVVSKAVNMVGVNLNTASRSLLTYVSGLTKKNIDKLLTYRDQFGKFHNRLELKKQKLVSDKVYEQAIGFLRIPDGDNPLDATGIHPESYAITNQLLDQLGMTIEMLGTTELRERLERVDLHELATHLGTDYYTLEDIAKSLSKPNRDPRDEIPAPILKSDILQLEDLKVGMELQGTVRNVVDFGAFIDIGLKNDGLAHISKLTDHYIKHPSEVVNVGDIVTCYVDEILLEKKKVALSLLRPQ